MRDRLRNFDSKITFFAFADIITAVSGMLIFITLLLATDLGRPTDNRSQAADAELQRQLDETLSQQAAADAENRGLQNILTTANTAPAPEQLESDISQLRAELTQEKSKHAGIVEQLAASQSSLEARDKTLGITGLQSNIEDTLGKLATLTNEDAKVRDETVVLESDLANVQSKIAKLRSREGQLWLIPDRAKTSKEPLLAVVSSGGVRVERFDHPDQSRVFDQSDAHSGFESFLKGFSPSKQYVVFLIRPSGIGMFKDIVEIARQKGFEIGFDALEENKEVHFSRPPPIDDQEVTSGRPGGSSGRMPGSPGTGGPRSSDAGGASGAGNPDNTTYSGPSGTDTTNQTGSKIPGSSGNSATSTELNGTSAETNGTASGTNTTGSLTNVSSSGTNTVGSATNATAGLTNGSPSSTSTTGNPPPPPKPKSWWQRFLEWIGIG